MLIANIGLQHFGSLEKAKELIRVSNDSGADLIKGIAVHPLYTGPMDIEFYEMTHFVFDEYIELIDYAKSIGNDLFFDIYGNQNESLNICQSWASIHSENIDRYKTSEIDKDNVLVFIDNSIFPPALFNANIIYTMDSLSENANLERINILKKVYNRNIGYKDKTIGIKNCIIANDEYHCLIIEKNITLEKGILFKGKIIEENVYSCLPNQFEDLANNLMLFKEDIILH